MGPVLEAMDWSTTSIGEPAGWPQSLRSAASVCLGAKYPIAIYWGPDLTLIYNEAWSHIPGDRHPWALGRSGPEVWPEIWHIVGPEFEAAMAGEGLWNSDRLLPMERHGFLEETYFNYNLSPIVGEDGGIAGVFNAGLETTGRVLSERRNRLLIDVAGRSAGTATVHDACQSIMDALDSDRATIPFALLYLFETTTMARLAGCVGVEDGDVAAMDEVRLGLRAGDDPWRLADVRSRRRSVVHQDLGRFGTLPAGDWPDPPTNAVTLPVVRGGPASRRRVIGALVLGVPAGRRIDAAMLEFFDMLTDLVASVLVNARLDEQERRAFETEHRIATTLQRSLMPELPEVDGIELRARYLPGSAEVDVGGDWYDAVALPGGEVAMVIGDVMGKGVTAAAQMGQLRNATRAYLLEGFSPATVLDKLNRLTISLSATGFATVLCLYFDPATRAVRWCRAGHPPALVRSASGSTRYLEAGGSPPIAVFPDARFVDATDQLEPGDELVLYSDGLVERRDEDIDVGLARLAALAEGDGSTASLIDRLVEPVLTIDRRDDVAVLVAST